MRINGEGTKKKLDAAMVRRFGASLLPYSYKPCDWGSVRCVQVTDLESGHWIIVAPGKRLRVVSEQEGAL